MDTCSPPIRVLIVDDQTLFRVGLAHLLESDPRITIVGEAADGAEAVRLIGSTNPDAVLRDLKMPSMDGISATREITENHPDGEVVILTTFDAHNQVFQAPEAGCV